MLRYAALTGWPLRCVIRGTGVELGRSEPEFLPLALRGAARTSAQLAVVEHASGLITFAIPLDGGAAVLGYALSRPGIEPIEIKRAAADAGWNAPRLKKHIARLPCGSADVVRTVLELAAGQLEAEANSRLLRDEVHLLDEQVEYAYREASVLHSLARNMQISRSPIELAQICLARLHPLTSSEGTAIYLRQPSGDPVFLTQGELPLGEKDVPRLAAAFPDHPWPRPLLRETLGDSSFARTFPGIRDVLIVPIAEGRFRSGWILSCNRLGAPFASAEASLLNSIGAILGTHLRNAELYQQNDALMLSFVRSLVSALDAKDPYTRGHSERVAAIARRLGEELGLAGDDLEDVYLAGLLHDIGKVGTDDRILRKDERLTPEEFAEIQKHPLIGYSILKCLSGLHGVLPGVRNHHERYSGGGYPDRLVGEEIPFMARILAVADAYDAMGSDRPYRPGMPLDELEAIFRDDAGAQWDPRVIDAYFAVREDVRRLCRDFTPDMQFAAVA